MSWCSSHRLLCRQQHALSNGLKSLQQARENIIFPSDDSLDMEHRPAQPALLDEGISCQLRPCHFIRFSGEKRVVARFPIPITAIMPPNIVPSLISIIYPHGS